MKKIITLSIILLAVLTISAQAPNKMSYQAVIRNASNTLVSNTNIGVRVSILQTTANGTVVFSEYQTLTTNVNGLVTIEIGTGTLLTGNFSAINWANGPYFIKTETDPTGPETNYTISGTSQLLSVPYALYAATAGSSVTNFTQTGNNIANNNLGNVGIGTGTTIPSSLLTVKKSGVGFTQEDATGAAQIGFYTDATNAYLQTHSNTDLTFSTNNGGARMVLQKTTGNFGIGVVVPTQKLEVNGTTKTTNLQVTDGSGVGKVLTSDATGNASWTTNVSPNANTGILLRIFNAIIPNQTPTRVKFDSKEYDPSNSYDTTTGEWIIPSAGFYHINVALDFNFAATVTGYFELSIYKNGVKYKAHYYEDYNEGLVISLDAPFTAGDAISIYVEQGTGSTLNNPFVYLNKSYLSGYKIY